MQDTTITLLTPADSTSGQESSSSAISWPSIIGGALAMVALSLVFLTFGGALGIAPSTPPDTGRAAWVFTSMAAIWLIVTQWLASAVGGYLTGRLRTKWTATHTHEVFFRDTAHGFLAWAAATLFGVILLSSTIASAFGHMHGHGNNGAHDEAGPVAFYVDSLYRSNPSMTPASMATETTPPAASATESVPVTGAETTPAATPVASAPAAPMATRLTPDLRAESARLLMRGMGRDKLSDDDKTYLAQLVAEHTGLSQSDAVTRVDTILAQEQADAQKMRKSAGYLALFTALSMLIGAFVAAAAAAFGGSQRDEWEEAVRAGTYRP